MTTTRRTFLIGATATLALRAHADPLPRRLLPDPDFGRLRATDPHLVGVRPHRLGGVRLELEALASKQVVHNYGHGGAGITLAFGCADVAAGLVDQAVARLGASPASVAVLGTGVIGLASALAVRSRRPELPVTVYAKDLRLRSTTSYVAGGQFEPSGIWREHQADEAKARLEDWLRRSRDRIVSLRPVWGRYGIAVRDNYTLDHEILAMDGYMPRDVVPAPRLEALPFARLNAPGRMYRTWLLDPTRLLPALASELAGRGVRFAERTFASLEDLAKLPEPVVVNCTGYGARALCGDDRLVPQRGHLVVLERPSEEHTWLFAGGCENHVTSYVFCRNDDIVVGGTVIAGDERTEVVPEDDAVFARILANAAEVFAGRPDRCLA